MDLNLLELIYAVTDREKVETWLAEAGHGTVLVSAEQYDDEVLAVLASGQEIAADALRKLVQRPEILSCEGKRRVVFRMTTAIAPELLIRSFPLGEDEEWYRGTQHTAYLCVRSPQLSGRQLSWLDNNRSHIAAWDDRFDLTPLPPREGR